MIFTDVTFCSHGFSLTREDQIQVLFPYTKVDYVTVEKATGTMKIEVKRHGSFIRHYTDVDAMMKDADKLLAKGKV